MIASLRLNLVTHLNHQSHCDYNRFLKQAIKGGVTSVQFREKAQNKIVLENAASLIQKTLKPFNIPFIINDYLDLALKINADGVHLGQNDVSPILARKKLGPQKIIGWSIESIEQLLRANELDCIDYIGASAIFFSKTKPGCKKLWGIDGLKQIVKLSRHPVIAIGGINTNNVESVIDTGASGVAVIGAIHDYPNTFVATKKLSEKIKLSLLRTTNERRYQPNS